MHQAITCRFIDGVVAIVRDPSFVVDERIEMGILMYRFFIGHQNPNDVISGLKFDLTDPRAIISQPHKKYSVESHKILFGFQQPSKSVSLLPLTTPAGRENQNRKQNSRKII